MRAHLDHTKRRFPENVKDEKKAQTWQEMCIFSYLAFVLMINGFNLGTMLEIFANGPCLKKLALQPTV